MSRTAQESRQELESAGEAGERLPGQKERGADGGSRRGWWLPAMALVLALGSLAYFTLIYLPSVAEFNQEHGYSGGYGSDLYSRWYGARELLLHGRDPYSAEITAEMQRGFVGREPLPGEEMPEWAVFAQPLYTVFLIAPLALLNFSVVQSLATVLFPLLIGLGGLLWLIALGGPCSPSSWSVALLLSLSAPATLYAATFQQLSAPVFLLLAGAFLLASRGRFAWAGLLLALSTIKPQESWLLIGLLLAWAVFGWRERRGLVIGFALSMLALLVASELLLPGWIFKFLGSLGRYSEQTAGLQLLGGLPQPALIALALAWLALLGWGVWEVRHEPAGSARLAVAGACALAVTVVLIPAYLQYERIFLLPALLALLFRRELWPASGIGRIAPGLALPLMLSPWVLAAALGALQVVGVPVREAPPIVVALPWVPYAFLAYVAVLALLPAIKANKGG